MTTIKEPKVADAASKRGDLMPLDFLLSVFRDECVPMSLRLKAAKAALPYCHPKLASIQDSGPARPSHEECVKAMIHLRDRIQHSKIVNPSHEGGLNALADGDTTRRCQGVPWRC
jgi:hypothetical protein